MKISLKESFSKAAPTYDANAGFQREVAREVAGMLPENTRRVLDVGCGTGAVMEYIKEKAPSLYGCDAAKGMLRVARSRMPCRFVCADFAELPFPDSSFDSVASSLAYQWAVDIAAAFKEARRVLKPGGAFVFSTLGRGTFHELRNSIEEAKRISGRDGLPPFMHFPDKEELFCSLKEAGFGGVEIHSALRTRRYRGLPELLKTLKNLGAVNPNASQGKTLAAAAVLKEAARVYERLYATRDGIAATYEVIFAATIRYDAGKRCRLEGLSS
jgi:malonyl-CoA O-methyltransferase